MSDLVDLALPTTRTGIADPTLLLHHLLANLCTGFYPVSHSDCFHPGLRIPPRNIHHCTFHSSDCGELASLLFPAEAHVLVAGWAVLLSLLRPGSGFHDYLLRVLSCRDPHCLGPRRPFPHGRGFSPHCYLGLHCLCSHLPFQLL